MAAERLARILALLAADDRPSGRRLCEVAAEATAMSGAGIALLTAGGAQASLGATDSVSSLIEDLQYTLGEGPCIDAQRLGTVIAEPNLAATSRWTAFSERALAGGAKAVFGFPIRLGAVALGALDLYRDQPGPLTDDQHADALVMADVAARFILSAQADAPPGDLDIDIATDTHLWGVVHQAAGMVSVQLDIPVADALVRIRAHAFGADRRITEIARDIVERRLSLDDDS